MSYRMMLLAFVPLFSAVAGDGGCPVSQNKMGRENTEWSISYAFHMTDENRNLPRVLLVGDSICNGYQEGVRKLTDGRCNVSYWVSSYCVTRPEYLRLLEFYLDDSEYAVIHFNNGLHSTRTETPKWASALSDVFRLIRDKQPKAKIVWATSTPLKSAEKSVKVRELNEAASEVVRNLGGIVVNDLYSLLDPFDREEYWSDMYHHKMNLRQKEAEQVATTVLSILPASLSAELRK